MIRRRVRRGFEWGFVDPAVQVIAAAVVALVGAGVLAAGLLEQTRTAEPLRMPGTRPASAEEIHERGERRLEDLLKAAGGHPLTHETAAP